MNLDQVYHVNTDLTNQTLIIKIRESSGDHLLDQLVPKSMFQYFMGLPSPAVFKLASHFRNQRRQSANTTIV